MQDHISRLTRMLGCACLSAFLVAAFPSHAVVPANKGGVAWQAASSESDVDAAFALAKRTGRPVFLYWGAVWCPPCNQVKATLFSRADFIERSRAFIPVYVDGDKPGAQKVAARFKVSGYPTMVLFKPDGTEVTRLPGEVDPERYLLTLAAGLESQVPVRDLLERALSKRALSGEQWRLLALYSWDTDHQQVVTEEELPAKLSQLAAAVPQEYPQLKSRLVLKAVAARADANSSSDARMLEADRAAVVQMLADPQTPAAVGELLVYYAEPIVKYLGANSAERAKLAASWDAVLERRLGAGLSRSDMIDTLEARVDLWKLVDQTPVLSRDRQQWVLKSVAQTVAQTTDRFERQAVIPSAAHALASAGLLDESDNLLKAELPRAVAPYYHMLALAGNAKKRGDAIAALNWYEQAWAKSEGPATRIQWGVNYVTQLIELTPNDSARIAKGLRRLVSGLDPRAETFYERNQRSLMKMAAALRKWEQTDASRAKILREAQGQLADVCRKIPVADTGKANCSKVFSA